MRIKNTLYLTLSLCLCYVADCFCQSPDNESLMMKPNLPEGTKYVYYEEFKQMPKGYAEDFPIYSDKITYHKYGKFPRLSKDVDLTKIDPAKSLLGKIKMIDMFGFEHKYPVGKEEKVRDWYLRNAKTAGYNESEFAINDMKDIIEMKYSKQDSDVSKEVSVRIARGKILVTAFKDTPIEKEFQGNRVSDNDSKKAITAGENDGAKTEIKEPLNNKKNKSN